MGREYQTNAQALGANLFKDPAAAAALLCDIADEQINAGALEPVEDAVEAILKQYVEAALASIQKKMGKYSKFAGDGFDDPEAAVDFILAEIDYLVNVKQIEPFLDAASVMARGYLIEALTAQQAKLAAVAIAAED